MKTLLVASLLCCGLSSFEQLQQIPLKVSNAYQTNHVATDVTKLIDGDTSTRFNPTYPGYTVINPPHRIVFDLTDYDPCTVKRLRYFDGYGAGYNAKFILVKKSDNSEHTFFNFTGNEFLVWRNIDIPIDSQFVASKLIIESPSGGDGYPDEIQVWGNFSLHRDPVWNRKAAPLKNFLMANCHPWDIDSLQYPGKYKALVNLNLHGLRLYSDIIADKDASGNYALNPEIRGFQPERTFKALLKIDSTYLTQLCFQGQSSTIKATWDAAGKSVAWDKPYGLDSTNPRSYMEVAKDMFVLAGRGGKNASVPDYPIYPQPHWYDSANEMVKGGRFYKVIEGGNEWDNWYSNDPKTTYMGGAGLAAAWSAMYDGHNSSLGSTYGVKNADPSVQFANSGIAWDRPDLFREAIEWWRLKRGVKKGRVDIPTDSWNIHSYSGSSGQFGSSGGFPAEYGMLPQLKQMVYFSNKYGNGLPVVISEWGWDVHPNSILNAPAYGSYTAQQTRGNWAVRAICSFAEAGIDAAQWYRLYQDYYTGDPNGGNYANDNNATQFATMALLRQHNFKPDSVSRTVVGDYFKQLSEFGNYTYDTTFRGDSVHMVRFTNGANYLYALWTTESFVIDASNHPVFTERSYTYNLQITGNKRQLVDGLDSMSSQNFDRGNIVLKSKPIFIVHTKSQIAPIVTATDKSVNWPANTSTTLSCDALDADGFITRYVWTKISGPSSCIIVSPANGVTQVTGLTKGTYYFRITVTDDDGNTAFKDVKVVVDRNLVSMSATKASDTGESLALLSPTLNSGVLKVVFYNCSGQVIKTGNSLDVTKWKRETQINGMYLFQYQMNDGSLFTEKYLKYN
jgi:hypothetical protein